MNEEEVRKVLQIQKIRRIVVFAALGLLIFSFVQHIQVLSYFRAALWAGAGILSIVEALGLKKLGQQATNAYVNAALYLAVAVLPVLRGY